MKNTYKDKYLHIVSFDIPVPVNYGGAIDVFYKLKFFHKIGVKVIFHCFSYGGRTEAKELDEICEEVHYYPRKSTVTKILGKHPSIVSTRTSEDLIIRLSADDYPILFEGIHSCYYVEDKRIQHKIKVVRTHNIEHDYYLNLAKVEKKKHARLYYKNEAIKLKEYENVFSKADGIAAISKNDMIYFKKKKYTEVETVSAFHPYEKVEIKPGIGDFALYHGSLEVGENNRAAIYLVEKVFSGIDYPLYIAGNKASKELKKAVSENKNVVLKENLDSEEINNLISQAQVNILPTFQATGIKLKLLAALYIGRHCIVNTPMIKDTDLEDLCLIEDSADGMKKKIIEIKEKVVSEKEINLRKAVLENNGFSNDISIYKLGGMLFTS
jgi:hypothetical protein